MSGISKVGQSVGNGIVRAANTKFVKNARQIVGAFGPGVATTAVAIATETESHSAVAYGVSAVALTLATQFATMVGRTAFEALKHGKTNPEVIIEKGLANKYNVFSRLFKKCEEIYPAAKG